MSSTAAWRGSARLLLPDAVALDGDVSGSLPKASRNNSCVEALQGATALYA